MLLGDILLANGLATEADIAAGLERQRTEGGRLGDNLVALGRMRLEDLELVMHGAPPTPRSLADTGVAPAELLNLAIKAMYSGNFETPSRLGSILKLPNNTIQLIIQQAQERKLVATLGAAGSTAVSELRYALTEKGKQWAIDALAQSQYVGPAPVSLAAFSDRILRQRITNERVDKAAVESAFAKMVISEAFTRQIGPAVNSGRSILLYGAPGNGKTSIAETIGSIFKDIIYIPYCLNVDGHIIKVFDPGIHRSVLGSSGTAGSVSSLRRDEFDQRWVPCRRPFIVTGGELTLEMLDLIFNAQAKFYEAPLHIKAIGGIFVIDDFGRQIVSPEALLNRWIVPLESRVEYLKLHTGKSFSLPFDELVIFSTNMAPSELMDPAFLRRIPYKLEILSPSPHEYREIFRSVAKALGIEASDTIIDFVISELRERNDFPLASFQPKFIIEQVRAACKFEGIPPQLQTNFVSMALGNLYTKDTPGYGVRSDSVRVIRTSEVPDTPRLPIAQARAEIHEHQATLTDVSLAGSVPSQRGAGLLHCACAAQSLMRSDRLKLAVPRHGRRTRMIEERKKLLVYFDDEEHLVRRLGVAVVSCWFQLPPESRRTLFDRAKLVLEDDDTIHLDEDLRHFIAEHSKDALEVAAAASAELPTSVDADLDGPQPTGFTPFRIAS